MSSKKPRRNQPSGDGERLVVWGERRTEPDWDRFIAALAAFALREVDERAQSPEEEGDE